MTEQDKYNEETSKQAFTINLLGVLAVLLKTRVVQKAIKAVVSLAKARK